MSNTIADLHQAQEALKKQGRQVCLAINARVESGEDTRELHEELEQVADTLAKVSGELADYHLRRSLWWASGAGFFGGCIFSTWFFMLVRQLTC